MTSVQPRTPRFYFSFRSPYSWLAYHDLTTRYPEVADRLEWIPFWEPDETSRRMLSEAGGRFVYAPMSREKSLYILQDVRRLASDRGLRVSWPVDRAPWWEVAHLAYLVAARYGRKRQFVDAVYRARWQQGRDISDRATIAEVAEEVGLSPDLAAGAVDDSGVRAEGLRALLDIDRDGVFGVPFFVRRFDKYWGLDRLAPFVATLRRSAGAVRPAGDAVLAMAGESAGELRPFEDDHAGGCG